MGERQTPAPGRAQRRAIPSVALWLAAAVACAQVVAAFLPAARTAILGGTLIVLDLTGAVASFRAARTSVFGDAWRLAAAGRACSAVSLVAVGLAYAFQSALWCGVAVAAHLSMFAALGVAAVVLPLRRMPPRRRAAQIAEIVTVLGGGFMLVWYFTIHPSLELYDSPLSWLVTVGFPVGNLVLLVGVAVMPLTGALGRSVNPLTVYTAGLALYAVAHATWPITDPRTGLPPVSVPACLIMVTACLLLTVAALMVTSGWVMPPDKARLAMPPWSGQLSQVPLTIGCALLLGIIVRGDGHPPWLGLLGGLVVMTGGVVLRQHIAAGDRRAQTGCDPLTGLLSRSEFDRAVERALSGPRRVAVLLLNVDKFRIINGMYGHREGDAALVAFAQHLRSAVRASDVPARLGGDEFVVLLGVETEEQATRVVERVLSLSATSDVHLAGDTVRLRASAGVAFSGPGDSVEDLLNRAESAMHHAKEAGGNTFVRHDTSIVDRRIHDATLSDDLEAALHRGELQVAYQPLVDLEGSGLAGAEALLRWNHHRLGPVSPDEFIPLAERSGLITAIGLWVLEQACLTLREWQRHLPAGRPLYVSVNLSPHQLRNAGLVGDVTAVLNRTGVRFADLVLEVTETALVDEKASIAALEELRELGVRIAIDDFGTGYSSLSHLAHLPVDILKIDRSFVSRLDGTQQGSAITEAVVRLSQVLRLTTVAEGIETAEQAAELQLLGCDIGQGFLLGRPGPASAVTEMIISMRTSTA